MLTTEIRLSYLDWIKAYTNNDFMEGGEEVIPPIIELVIKEMAEYDSTTASGAKQAESLGDYSVTYDSSSKHTTHGYPKSLIAKLQPYKRIRFI